MTQCKLCTRAPAVAVAVNREVADGADLVFTDTENYVTSARHTIQILLSVRHPNPNTKGV